MRKYTLSLFCCMGICTSVYGQQLHNDTAITNSLDEVVIHAYEYRQPVLMTPTAINTINRQQLERFDNTSILPAINSTPGVRMEERSPGSYRISIRGSSLRAPYGVRNTKVYYNGIPLTDPSGQTYLNQLGFYNVRSLEIIKGPGSSLYGAGTGGVILLNSTGNENKSSARIDYTAGSYGLNSVSTELNLAGKKTANRIRYQHISADGYRDHSAMQRDVASWDASLNTSPDNALTAHFLYSDLYYQTPGALTLAQYTNAPQASRPASGSFPAAAAADASIRSQMFLAGFTNTHSFNSRFRNTTTLYGIYSRILNPTIQNYDRRTEPHTGGRTTFKYQIPTPNGSIDIVTGAELQKGFSTVKTYENSHGQPGTLQFDDEVNSLQYFGFAQASWNYKNIIITGGLSLNRQKTDFVRLSDSVQTTIERSFNNGISPRIAVLYRTSQNNSVYVNIVRGFSPPTTSELLTSNGFFDARLRAEEGWNYEMGTRGVSGNRKFRYDVSTFFYRLRNAIVTRRDAGGGNYFTNAGGTRQFGIEAYSSYALLQQSEKLLKNVSVWAAYSYYRFTYQGFVQLEDDFSGNGLPGTPPHTVSIGADISSRHGIYSNVTYNFVDRIPLNDAGIANAAAYHLVSVRFGYNIQLAKTLHTDVYAGVNNLADEIYSLGNDINGFGGRYYNAAPGRNFFAGIRIGWNQ